MGLSGKRRITVALCVNKTDQYRLLPHFYQKRLTNDPDANRNQTDAERRAKC